jgi:hypothetical protein
MFRRPRKEDPKHLARIRQLPCAVCPGENITATEAAHVRSSCLKYGKRGTGMGQKPDDKWTVPLCSAHHTGPGGQHSMNEMEFWRKHGIDDPFALAMALHDHSEDYETAVDIIALHKGKQ